MKKTINTFFEFDKIKHNNIKPFVSDFIIYNNCKTISSNIPLCEIMDNNSSTIHKNHEEIHINSNKFVIQKNKYLTNLKQYIKNASISYNKNILTGDYLIFTS